MKLCYHSNTQICKKRGASYSLNYSLSVTSAFFGKTLDLHTLLISRKRQRPKNACSWIYPSVISGITRRALEQFAQLKDRPCTASLQELYFFAHQPKHNQSKGPGAHLNPIHTQLSHVQRLRFTQSQKQNPNRRPGPPSPRLLPATPPAAPPGREEVRGSPRTPQLLKFAETFMESLNYLSWRRHLIS